MTTSASWTRAKVATIAAVLLMSGSACHAGDATGLSEVRFDVGDVARAATARTAYAAGIYSQEIGSEGGTLDFQIGELEFPAKSLPASTVITAAIDGRTFSVRFEPAGLQFPDQARPVLRFRVGTAVADNGAVLYVDDHDVIHEVLATFRTRDQTAIAELRHFSKYIFGVE